MKVCKLKLNIKRLAELIKYKYQEAETFGLSIIRIRNVNTE